jgi:hypothetical protein
LNRRAGKTSVGGIGWRCTRDKHKANRLHGLPLRRWGFGGFGCEYELTGHCLSYGRVNDGCFPNRTNCSLQSNTFTNYKGTYPRAFSANFTPKCASIIDFVKWKLLLRRQLNMGNHFSHPRSRVGGNPIFLTRQISILGSRPAQPLWLFVGAGLS